MKRAVFVQLVASPYQSYKSDRRKMNTRDMYMHGASKTKSRSRSGIRPGPATAVVAVLAIAALLTGGLATAYGAPASPKRSQPLNTAAATRAASHPQVT